MLPHRTKAKFFDSLSRRTLRHVEPITVKAATGVVAEVYEQVTDEFFINGAITAHSLNPPLLVGMWIGGRELVLVDGGLTRDDKQALGSTFAQLNGCSYCEDLLVGVTYASRAPRLARAIRQRAQDSFEDQDTAALHRWALATTTPEADALRTPPFGPELAAEALGVSLVFHYLNRFTRVFFDGSPVRSPLLFEGATSSMLRVFAIELRPSIMRRLQPGRANTLLPEAALPEDLWWARGNPRIVDPVSRWVGTIDAQGEAVLSEAARARVEGFLAGWRGEPMGLTRAWLQPYTRGLAAHDAVAVRIALLTAIEGTQINDELVSDFIECWAGQDPDAALVTTVVWAAMKTARRITGWVAEAARASLKDWSSRAPALAAAG